MTSPRNIRLYPNRRLYDSTVAGYITFDDVYALLQDGISIKIKDTVGGKDQTQKVLTDLLVREELNAAGRLRQQVFTAEFLKELIRVSATKEALLLSAFLDHTMNMLIEATTGERQPGTRR